MGKKFLIFFVLAFVVAVFFVCVKVQAAGNASGWSWGGGAERQPDNDLINYDGTNTNFGWISLNSANCDINGDGVMNRAGGDATAPAECPADGTGVGDYGVDVPSADGDLSGHAWSENFGWISFEPVDLVGCPSGNCAASRNGNNISGWARILSIKNAYEAIPSNSGGWKGWVSLSGTATDGSPYGVSAAGSSLSGYAWSDELGWVNFTPGIPQLIICPDNPVLTVEEVRQMKALYWENTTGAVNCLSAGGKDVADSAVWSSDNLPVLTISEDGLATAVSAGDAVIKATYAGIIEVQNATVASVANTCSYNLCGSDTGYECQTQVVVNGTCPASNCSDTATPETCAPSPGRNWRETAP